MSKVSFFCYILHTEKHKDFTPHFLRAMEEIMRNENERYEAGYEREREASAATKLSYILIGGGIGAVLALLFAPKSGTELRGDIADATRKGLEKGKEAAAVAGEKAGEYYEVTRDKASELYSTAQDKAGELTEKARGAVSSASNPFSAALDAGRSAYSEEKRRNQTDLIGEERPTYPIDDKVLELPTDVSASEDNS